jgi:hypothetical protein
VMVAKAKRCRLRRDSEKISEKEKGEGLGGEMRCSRVESSRVVSRGCDQKATAESERTGFDDDNYINAS